MAPRDHEIRLVLVEKELELVKEQRATDREAMKDMMELIEQTADNVGKINKGISNLKYLSVGAILMYLGSKMGLTELLTKLL